ncbi:hypothetical protein [Lacisediminihabitans profunda]|uniref:Uncharacterized protein n=1 Tax=Lacisediminihabitans profunda TaxID=2594790 RepID=A0A5C8UW65_9MICO|nr:hypothetical protein [Lacisediminihabitans profunda]TXN31895.1 hypothetical protein FVP33_02940 [Lacisediminihabitans profunda]
MTPPTSASSTSRSRIIIALVLAAVAIPLLVLGLIDPLEGGLALVGVVVLGVAVRLLSKVRVPRLAWISIIATVAVGALTIVLAVTARPQPAVGGTVASPVSGVILGLLWVYRLGVLSTLAGGVLYIVRLVGSLERNRR